MDSIEGDINSISESLFVLKSVGGVCDGGNAMQGGVNGVKGRFLSECPRGVFGWCICHLLQLATKDVLEDTFVSSVLGFCKEICNYFNKSPLRLSELQEIVEMFDGVEKLKSFGFMCTVCHS